MRAARSSGIRLDRVQIAVSRDDEVDIAEPAIPEFVITVPDGQRDLHERVFDSSRKNALPHLYPEELSAVEQLAAAEGSARTIVAVNEFYGCRTPRNTFIRFDEFLNHKERIPPDGI